MLSKFILAGLVPGMMAKPIDRREYYAVKDYAVKPMSVSTPPAAVVASVSTMPPKQGVPTAAESWTTSSFSVLPVSTFTSVPPTWKQTSPSSFPVAPPPRMQSPSPSPLPPQPQVAVPAGEYAVATPPYHSKGRHQQQHTAVPSASVAIHFGGDSSTVVPFVAATELPSYAVKSSAAPSIPAERQYAVAEMPAIANKPVPVSSSASPSAAVHVAPPFSSASSSVSAVVAVPSMPAKVVTMNSYPVKESFPSTTTTSFAAPVLAATPSSVAPKQHNSYAVKEFAATTSAAAPVLAATPSTMPKQESYPVKEGFVTSLATPSAAVHVAPTFSSSSSVAPVVAVPSMPAKQNSYPVKESFVTSMAAPELAATPSKLNSYAVKEPQTTSVAAPVLAAPSSFVAPKMESDAVEPPMPTSMVAPVAALPSIPAEQEYAVADPPVPSKASHVSAPAHFTDGPVAASPPAAAEAIFSSSAVAAVAQASPAAKLDAGEKDECIADCDAGSCAPDDTQCFKACVDKCHGAKSMMKPSFTGDAGKEQLKTAIAADDVPAAAAKGKASPEKLVKPVKPGKAEDSHTPGIAAGAGFESYEACMTACNSKFQYADLVFPISQGKRNCASACASYESSGSGVTVNNKRAVEPVKGALRPAPPAFDAGAGFQSYEACLTACEGRWQKATMVFPISQGKGSCKVACARYASEGSGIKVHNKEKRAVEPVKGALKPAPPAFDAGAGYNSYEACMKACNGRWQSANLVFTISQGDKACAEACASYESNGSGVTVNNKEKRAVEPVSGALRPAPPALKAGAGFSSYEACVKKCNHEKQTADMAFKISQGKSSCAEACASYASEGSDMIVNNRRAVDTEEKRAVEPVKGALRPAPPALKAGAGYASYEACLSECHGRWQTADMVFPISQGRKSCTAACASYMSEGSDLVIKREEEEEAVDAIEKRAKGFPFEEAGNPFKKAEPQEGPFSKTPETTAGAATGEYEACMHGCRVRLGSADVDFEVDQGDNNCATQCAGYSVNGANLSHA